MNILLSGYVLREGRMSMIHYARSLRAHLGRIIHPDDRIALDESPEGSAATQKPQQGVAVKFEKRIGVPWRLRRRHYDVLHIVDNDYLVAVPERRLADTVVTCHDMMPVWLRLSDQIKGFGFWGSYFYEQNMRKMAKCAHVITDSTFSRQSIIEHTHCSENRVEVVPIGVDRDLFHPLESHHQALEAFRRRHGLHGKKIVLHIGARMPYKNVETVLRVVNSLVRHGHTDVVLLKIGLLTPEQENLAAQLKIVDRIILLPHVEVHELPLAYNAADLLLWPSWYEGFGLCVVEAMACGTPVVCSNGGALAETAGNAAAIHDPNDVEGLTASCKRLLDDAAYRAELRSAGLAWAGRFRWEHTAEACYRIYTDVHAKI